MRENIIIYEESPSVTEKGWTETYMWPGDFRNALGNFYEYCGGKVTPDVFRTAINFMAPAQACELFNQLANGVVLKKMFVACEPTELYGGNNGK